MDLGIASGRPLGPVCLVADLGVLGPDPRPRVRDLLAAGLSALQIRAKGWPAREVIRTAAPLRDLAAGTGALFVVNGDPALVTALEADGLHLPAGSGPIAGFRARVPDGVAIGASCHDAAELALAAGADWVFLSPVFPTASKPGARGLGLDGFGTLARRARAPVYALGGVDAGNAADCLAAGAAGIAAIRALVDPGGRDFVRALLAAVRSRPESPGR
jgi:thiamine-phosphate diphosphorylase